MMRLHRCPKNTHIKLRPERPKHLTFDFHTIGTIIKSCDVDYHIPRTKATLIKSEEEYSPCNEAKTANKEGE